MNIIINTPRLYLREFIQEDATHFFDMNNDSDVIRYTGDLPFQSIEDAKKFIEAYNQYTLYGIGRWAVCEKKSNSFLGFCGLKYHPNQNLVELGYRFKKKYWGQGYATESSLACLDYGFNNLKFNAIYAHVNHKNSSSAKVLDRCEMEYLFDCIHDNEVVMFYRKTSPHLKIKPINTEETIAVRHPVLRAGRPREDCYFPGDDLSTTVHYGIFQKNKFAGIATFLEQNNPAFEGAHLQLRGMAILDEFKGKGFGKLLLETGQQLAVKKKKNLIWCNARIIAVPFYERLGYKTIGNSFEIPQVGTHFAMYKIITTNKTN
ncbi:MAG: GNAT family N-acetyltransferase [Flavobacteriaceae bacterium]